MVDAIPNTFLYGFEVIVDASEPSIICFHLFIWATNRDDIVFNRSFLQFQLKYMLHGDSYTGIRILQIIDLGINLAKKPEFDNINSFS